MSLTSTLGEPSLGILRLLKHGHKNTNISAAFKSANRESRRNMLSSKNGSSNPCGTLHDKDINLEKLLIVP